MTVEANAQKHTEEHILFCLSGSPANEKVIGIAARMADAYHGLLTGLLVETSAIKKLTDENRRKLHKSSEFAKQSGAQLVTVHGNDIARQISEYAKKNHVTKIAIGHSVNKNICGFCWQNNIDRITRFVSPDIEVYVIN